MSPGDDAPMASLFALLGPTLTEALGPALPALGVTKKEKVDAKSGLQVRNEIGAWTGAFGIPEFELYVGGRDANGVARRSRRACIARRRRQHQRASFTCITRARGS